MTWNVISISIIQFSELAYPKLGSGAPNDKGLITIVVSVVSSELARSDFPDVKGDTGESTTGDARREGEVDRVEQKSATVFRDRGRRRERGGGGEPVEVGLDVVVWGGRWRKRSGVVGGAVGAEGDPSEEEEDGEDEWEGVGPLQERRHLGGTEHRSRCCCCCCCWE